MNTSASATKTEWFEANAAAIQKRLAWLAQRPDGILFTGSGRFQKATVEKSGTVVRLRFFAPASTELQSAIDLQTPLLCLASYQNAILLSLAWRPGSARVHIIGLGGGRVPLVLHHCFPDLVIECTELDPEVYDISKKFFGLPSDTRLPVFLQDGRSFLEQRQSATPYEVIVVDAFRGIGLSPLPLATREFLAICKKQLSYAGVIVYNVLERDVFLKEKIKTIAACFQNTYLFRKDGSVVIFAHDGAEAPLDTILERAKALEKEHPFSFPISTLVSCITPLNRIGEFLPGWDDIKVLTDASIPHVSIDPLILNQIGRNDTCPCGSGRKFKKCHGVV